MKSQREGGLLIARIHQLAERIFTKKLIQYEIHDFNPAQGRILLVLWEEDGITIQELAKRTKLGKSTLTSMLERMEKAGHLNRKPCTQDRRKIRIFLTAPNQRIQHLYQQAVSEMETVFYAGFSEQEIQCFEDHLHRVLRNLEVMESSPAYSFPPESK